MSVFSADSVTIVRKKGDFHIREDITTAPFLPDLGVTREEYRANVVKRLRKDPSVALVLESKNGVCEELVALRDKHALTVRIVGTPPDAQPFDEVGKPAETACVMLTRAGDVVYHEDYKAEEAECGGQKMLEDVIGCVAEILDCIDAGDYSFLLGDDPGLCSAGAAEPLGFFEICQVLNGAGFQMESVHTVGFVQSPVLLVHENEVVLLGTHHFSGKDPFVEMKRLFFGVDPEAIRAAVKETVGKGDLIDVIEWEDGSWSFRATLDDDLDEDNTVDRLLSDLDDIRELIGKIEEKVGEEPWSIMAAQRQLFIYETVSESIKLSRLKI